MISYSRMFCDIERPTPPFQRICNKLDIPALPAGDLFHGDWPTLTTPPVDTEPGRPTMTEVYSRQFLAKLRRETAHKMG